MKSSWTWLGAAAAVAFSLLLADVNAAKAG